MYPMYIFALNVAKDMPNVKVINMTKPTTRCLHDYAVTPVVPKIAMFNT